tara:strand:+ start:764 stop:949 length:186 start_codon:yes stop_codon:yes gene_type:complete
MKTGKTEIKRVQDFLNQSQDLKPYLKEIVISSGVYKYYQDKFRELMFDMGTTNHPYPEERL